MDKLTIVWLPKAKKQLFHILSFWIDKNQSDTYSSKIEEKIREMTNHLSFNPKIGQKVEHREEVRRIVILHHLFIFNIGCKRSMTVIDSLCSFSIAAFISSS